MKYILPNILSKHTLQRQIMQFGIMNYSMHIAIFNAKSPNVHAYFIAS